MGWGALPASVLLDLAKQHGAYTQMALDLDCPPWVFVDPTYLTSCTKGHSVIDSSGNKSGIMATEDHPYFRETRYWLANNGYIEMQTGWLNGDRVTKPFYFNNVLLDVNDSFWCASAMSGNKDFTDSYNNGEPLLPEDYAC